MTVARGLITTNSFKGKSKLLRLRRTVLFDVRCIKILQTEVTDSEEVLRKVNNFYRSMLFNLKMHA